MVTTVAMRAEVGSTGFDVGSGARPRSIRGRGPSGAMAVAAFAAWVMVACTDESADQVTRPIAVGMTDHMTPYYSDGQVTLYQVQVPVQLPVRKLSAADVQAVGSAPSGTPYPRGVFLRAEDESVEVRFTLSNIDDTPHDVWLLIDPWNEFVRWRPGVTVVNDETTEPNFGYDTEFTLPPKQRVEGTMTVDDMHEIAIKLSAVEKLLASPQAQGATASGFSATQVANNIFNPQNRSNAVPPDPLYVPWIPPVVAGLTGFDLGLRTAESANVAVEITVDVQDLRGDRLVTQESLDRQMGPPPQVLSPPAARF